MLEFAVVCTRFWPSFTIFVSNAFEGGFHRNLSQEMQVSTERWVFYDANRKNYHQYHKLNKENHLRSRKNNLVAKLSRLFRTRSVGLVNTLLRNLSFFFTSCSGSIKNAGKKNDSNHLNHWHKMRKLIILSSMQSCERFSEQGLSSTSQLEIWADCLSQTDCLFRRLFPTPAQPPLMPSKFASLQSEKRRTKSNLRPVW